MRFFIFSCLFFGAWSLMAQEQSGLLPGEISYISPKNLYVKFPSTAEIYPGDSLFQKVGNTWQPVLVILRKSSTSCVCSIDGAHSFKLKDILYYKKRDGLPPVIPSIDTSATAASNAEPIEVAPVPVANTTRKLSVKPRNSGQLSAASYTSQSNYSEHTRMRYAFSYRADRIKKSRFSTDNYLVFRHTLGEWNQVQENLNDAFKIYSLSGKYTFQDNSSVTLGRAINPKISSMGAMDGVQFEKSFGKQVSVGVLGGSRPDLLDYGVDFSLLGGGLYMSWTGIEKHAARSASIAMIEHRNGGAVDRRFTYLQFMDQVTDRLFVFGSTEVDLYQKILEATSTKPRMTNILLSARYKVSKKIRLNASYDSRKNIFFYESYKLQIDSLIDQESRQGLRAGVQYNPMRLLNIGLTGSLRFQKSQLNTAKNFNIYANYSNLPWIKSNLNLTYNFLETSYLTSSNYGVRLNRSFRKDKWSAEVFYRHFEFDYAYNNQQKNQNLVGGNISYRLMRKLMLFVYAEQVKDSEGQDFFRFNTKVTQRF